MAKRIKLKRGGEVSLSVSDERGSIILMVEHRPAMSVVELSPEETRLLSESLLAVLARA